MQPGNDFFTSNLLFFFRLRDEAYSPFYFAYAQDMKKVTNVPSRIVLYLGGTSFGLFEKVLSASIFGEWVEQNFPFSYFCLKKMFSQKTCLKILWTWNIEVKNFSESTLWKKTERDSTKDPRRRVKHLSTQYFFPFRCWEYWRELSRRSKDNE